MKLATLCYVQDKANNTTLMLHRVKKENDMHEGKWNGLGGKMNPGETPEQCVIREVFEESGLKISWPVMKGFITFPAFDGVDDWYVFLFVVEQFEGEMIESNEGHLHWVPNNELLDLNLWDGDKIFLKWLPGGKFFSAKFVYENKHLVSHDVVFY